MVSQSTITGKVTGHLCICFESRERLNYFNDVLASTQNLCMQFYFEITSCCRKKLAARESQVGLCNSSEFFSLFKDVIMLCFLGSVHDTSEK